MSRGSGDAAPRPRPDGGASSLEGRTPQPAHHGPDGRFRNPWPGVEPHGVADLLRWGLQRAVRGVPPDPDPSAFRLVEPSLPAARPAAETAVTWIGHATVLLQLGGRNVLTDPMFGDRASPLRHAGPRRRVRPAIPIERLPAIHTVLVSHSHYDHLDAESVRAVAIRWPDARWHVPLALGATVRRMGARVLVEQDWWEPDQDGPLTVTATPAQHFSARTPFDRNRTLWCGWAVTTPGARAFFAGDTGHHPAFGEIRDRLGPFDLAMLPVGAYEPRWFMRPVHMNPEEAVRAFGELHGEGDPEGVMVPVHWGTFTLTDEPIDEPPRRTRAAWEASGRPMERLWLLRHGETRVLAS